MTLNNFSPSNNFKGKFEIILSWILSSSNKLILSFLFEFKFNKSSFIFFICEINSSNNLLLLFFSFLISCSNFCNFSFDELSFKEALCLVKGWSVKDSYYI